MLFAAPSPQARWALIGTILAEYRERRPASVLIEGLGATELPADFGPVSVHHLGFGCPCCTGLLPLEVALVRILRRDRPKMIILAALPQAHVDPLGAALSQRFQRELDVTTRAC